MRGPKYERLLRPDSLFAAGFAAFTTGLAAGFGDVWGLGDVCGFGAPSGTAIAGGWKETYDMHSI